MPKVHEIFEQELDNGTKGVFGIDDNGNAYWNGKPIVTEERIKLQWWVNAAVILGGIGAAVQGFLAVLTYLKP